MKSQRHPINTKLLQQYLEPSARPATGDLIIRDLVTPKGGTRGFGVRITSGTISFFIQRKMGGSTSVRRTIGSFPEWTVEQARVRAEAWRGDMAKRIDPRNEIRKQQKKTESEIARAKHTFGVVFGDFITAKEEGSAELTKKDRLKVQSKMERSALWKTPFDEVTSKIVGEALSPHFATSPANGWRIYRYGRAAYALEASKQKVFGNPFSEWRAQRKPKLLKRRDKVLPTGDKAGKVWLKELVKLRSNKNSYIAITADYLICVLLWGGRKTETQKLRVEDIDFERRYVIFRQENTKSGVAHCFPLTPWAETVLKQRLKKNAHTGDSWVFPSRVQGKHIVDIRRVLEMLTAKSGLKIGAHDLRRTFASELLSDSNANLFVVKMAMNHADVSQDVTVGYMGTKSKIEALRPVYETRERRLMQLAGLTQSTAEIPGEALKIIREAATNPELKKLLKEALR